MAHAPRNRKSRKVLTQQQWSAPGLEQLAEIVEGTLPHEYANLEELRGVSRTLWPSPDAGVFNLATSPEDWEARRQTMLEEGYNRNGGQPRLPVAVAMEARGLWPTPTTDLARAGRGDRPSEMERKSPGLETQAMLAEKWPTPTKMTTGDYTRDGRTKVERPSLQGMAKLDAWPTPLAGNANPSEGGNQGGVPLNALVKEGSTGRLNPAWVAQLMGYPSTWGAISGPRPRARRNGSGKRRGSSNPSPPPAGSS